MLQNEAHVEERIRKYGLFEIYNSEITPPSIIYELPVTLVC